MRLQLVISTRFAEGGSSGGNKLLWGLLIGCGVIGVLCCGAAGFVGWFGYATIAKAVSEDPAQIRQNTDEILTLEIPDRFKPEAVINFEPPFFGKVASAVFYVDKQSNDFLMMGDAKGLEGRDPEQMFNNPNADGNAEVFAQNDEVNINIEKGENFEETSRETIERSVGDGTGKFVIIEGKDKETDEEKVLVYGSFPGKIGGGMLAMKVAKKDESVEEIKKLIDSIK